MSHRQALDELHALLALSVPLAAANLGQTLLGAVTTAVVGRMGEHELGAAGLGNIVYFTVAVFGMGIMLGLDPLVAQALGSRDEARARSALWQGLWLALVLGVPLSLAMLAIGAALEPFGVATRSAELTRDYILARLPGLVPFLAFVGARSYLQAHAATRPVVVAAVAANLVNLPLCWCLVLGDAGLARIGLGPVGLPSLGVFGAGLSGTICTFVQLFVLVLAVRRAMRGKPRLERRPDAALIGRALRLGGPIGLQMLAEFSVFALVAVLIATIDARSLAAHQVAITLASTTFMVPVGIGAAASVRVGHAVGRGDVPATRLSGIVSMLAGTGFMLLAALAFVLAPRPLAALVTSEAAVIEAVVPLLFVAAVFQLSDGLQAVAAGALRGAGDTRFALGANLFGHYLVGLPVGIALGFGLGLGARGLWWGLSVGLTCVAIALGLRFIRVSARPVARV